MTFDNPPEKNLYLEITFGVLCYTLKVMTVKGPKIAICLNSVQYLQDYFAVLYFIWTLILSTEFHVKFRTFHFYLSMKLY